MLQELIEAEATAVIGAGWNEHADTRTAYRNGHRDKTLTTQAGDLNLAIPQAGDTIAAGGAEDSQPGSRAEQTCGLPPTLDAGGRNSVPRLALIPPSGDIRTLVLRERGA
jgi:hypothetical protein